MFVWSVCTALAQDVHDLINLTTKIFCAKQCHALPYKFFF